WYFYQLPSGLSERHYATRLPGKADGSIIDDAWSQEYQQFGFAFVTDVTPERSANDRQVAQERNLFLTLLRFTGEYTTNDDGFTIGDQNLGIDLVLADGRHTIHFSGEIRLILGNYHFHDHLVVR